MTSGPFERWAAWWPVVRDPIWDSLTSPIWAGIGGLGLFVAMASLLYAIRQFRLERSPLLFAYRGKDGQTIRVRNGGRGIAVQVVLLDDDLVVVDDSVTVLPPGSSRSLPSAKTMHQSVMSSAHLAYRDALGMRHETKLRFTRLQAEGPILCRYRAPRLRNLWLVASATSRRASRHLHKVDVSGAERLVQLTSWWRWSAWRAWARHHGIRRTSMALRWLYSRQEASIKREFADLIAQPDLELGSGGELKAKLDWVCENSAWCQCWHRQYRADVRAIVRDREGNVAWHFALQSGHQEPSSMTVVLMRDSVAQLLAVDADDRDARATLQRRWYDATCRFLNGRRPNRDEAAVTQWAIVNAEDVVTSRTLYRGLDLLQALLLRWNRFRSGA